jgi:hypothetical protein
MIRKLIYKDSISMYEFILRTKDSYEDFYITTNKARVFIKNLKLIEKLLKYQDVVALEESGEIKALLLIYKEKGFRPYLKILAEKNDYVYDLMKYVNWNYNCELFIKCKKINPISKISQKFFFNFIGDRGQEILLAKHKREIKNDKPINKSS